MDMKTAFAGHPVAGKASAIFVLSNEPRLKTDVFGIVTSGEGEHVRLHGALHE